MRHCKVNLETSGLEFWATFNQLWTNLRYSGLLFWATWLSRDGLKLVFVFVVHSLLKLPVLDHSLSEEVLRRFRDFTFRS